MKVLFTLITILTLGLAISAQGVQSTRSVPPAAQPTGSPAGCSLKMADLPEIRGLRLGMSEDVAERKIPVRFFINSSTGEIPTRHAVGYVNKSPGWENVDEVSLNAFENKVFSIVVKYDIDWSGADEFARNFAPKLHLPLEGWHSVVSFHSTLKCTDFTVDLDSISKTLSLTDDLSILKQAEAKLRADEAKKTAVQP
jgi:hypothetical protein